MHIRLVAFVIALFLVPTATVVADSGVITSQSAHSADATVKRFEAAIKKRGFMVFTHIDHAAAAKKAGLSMP